MQLALWVALRLMALMSHILALMERAYFATIAHLYINLGNNFSKNKNSISSIIECENLVSEDYVIALRKFIKYNNIKKIDLVALHGQTIFHSSKYKSSIQLCNSNPS